MKKGRLSSPFFILIYIHMIIEFSEYIRESLEFEKNITVPNLEKYYGAPFDPEGNMFVKAHQRRFLDKIYRKHVEFKTTWGEIVSGVVSGVQFNTYGKDGKINRITCKIYFRNGQNHNAKQRGRIKIFSKGIDKKHADIDPYGEEHWD